MRQRLQRTINRPAESSGIGFLTGADINLRFLPAEANHGIVFQRTDCPEAAPIPAHIEYTVPRRRRTAVEFQGTVVELTEHVLSALAGLQIDNCLIQLNAPELPGHDGSAMPFVDALMQAGVVELDATREVLFVDNCLRVGSEEDQCHLSTNPLARSNMAITYHLDYGPRSPIQPQNLTVDITPESYIAELAFARTFVLESEIDNLRAQGYGSRTTAKDLLVFGENGVVDNQMRCEDECARHKILDCIGDFALLGCDIVGHFNAFRSGHQLNREIILSLNQMLLAQKSESQNQQAA